MVTKLQYTYCLGTSNKQLLKKHKFNFGNYLKLIENDNKCGVFKKTFESRNNGHKHMRHRAS